MASAWGPHLQQVVKVPVSLSCDSGGGQKGHAVGGGTIHKLPRALPGHKVVLSPLGSRGDTAGTVALHLFWWPLMGLVPVWWGRWHWPLVRAPKQVVPSRTSPSVGCGCLVCVAV